MSHHHFHGFLVTWEGGGLPWEKPGSAYTHMLGLWYRFPGTYTTIEDAQSVPCVVKHSVTACSCYYMWCCDFCWLPDCKYFYYNGCRSTAGSFSWTGQYARGADAPGLEGGSESFLAAGSPSSGLVVDCSSFSVVGVASSRGGRNYTCWLCNKNRIRRSGIKQPALLPCSCLHASLVQLCL